MSKYLKIGGLVTLAVIGLSFLGGSAIWALLGFAPDAAIEGRAETVRVAPDDVGQGWSQYGGDAGGNRYSAAAQIDTSNVSDLDVAWMYRTGALKGREAAADNVAFEVTPILAGDKLVFCTPFNEVIALNPGSGEEIWRYDAKVTTDRNPANQYLCRGVSQWTDAQAETGAVCRTRLYMGTVDSRVIALDAQTGQPCTDFGDGGAVQIEPSLSLRWPGEMQISSAPAIVGSNVVVGSAIGDNLRGKAPRGTVHAFDLRSGAASWSFNPVPIDPADPARASWQDGSADRVGHANVWTTMSVDEARGLIFLPTSSASPDFYGGDRVGDNHYANSIVALNGETGAVVWSFQTVHHDVWDYDIPSQPGLYQVWKDGAAHDVVAVTTKTGLVFVLDRETGEPFLPIEERAVPQGGVEGEVLSPTQPFPVATPSIVPDKLNPKDAFGITYWDKRACTKRFQALRREGLFTPVTEAGTLVYPFTGGGANWGGSAYDPSRNLLIINMNNVAQDIRLIPQANEAGDENVAAEVNHEAEYAPMEGVPYAMSREVILSPLGLPCTPPPWGVIAGVDLASGEIVWRHPFGTTRDLAPGGLALKLGTPSFGGPIVTGGGVVFIAAAMDDYLRALDVETGEELWKGRLPAGGQATPMTYEWQGSQYVVIAAGGHSFSGTRQGDYVVAYKLPE